MPAAGLWTHMPRYGLSASPFLGSTGLWEPGPVASGWGPGGGGRNGNPPPRSQAISPPRGPAGSPGSRVRPSGGSGWQPAGSGEPAAGRAALGPGAGPPLPPPACGHRPAAAHFPLDSLGPGRDLLLSSGLIYPPPSCPFLWHSTASYSSPLPTGRVSKALGLQSLKMSCLHQPSDPPSRPKAWFLPHLHTHSDPDLPPAFRGITVNPGGHGELLSFWLGVGGAVNPTRVAFDF